jgi:glutamate dehydrogenase
MSRPYLDPNSIKPHTVADFGYETNVFAGKNEQMVQVADYLSSSGFLPKELVQNEVSWFYG